MSNREYFRLRFPPGAFLTLSTNSGDFDVCELSEGGLRLVSVDEDVFHIGQLVAGTMKFHDGSTAEVIGHAERTDHNELIVTRSEGVTFEQMMSEQRYIAQNFPLAAPLANTAPPTGIQTPIK